MFAVKTAHWDFEILFLILFSFFCLDNAGFMSLQDTLFKAKYSPWLRNVTEITPNIPWYKYELIYERIEHCLAVKILGELDSKLDAKQQCVLAAQKDSCDFGYIQRIVVSRSKWSCPLVHADETSHGILNADTYLKWGSDKKGKVSSAEFSSTLKFVKTDHTTPS